MVPLKRLRGGPNATALPNCPRGVSVEKKAAEMRGERRRRRGRRTNNAGWIAVSAQRVKPSLLAMTPACIFGGPSPLAITSLHRCPPLPRTNPTTDATILSLCLPPYWLRLCLAVGEEVGHAHGGGGELVTWSRGCGRGVPPRGQARYHPCTSWPGRWCSPAERSRPTSRAPLANATKPREPRCMYVCTLQQTASSGRVPPQPQQNPVVRTGAKGPLPADSFAVCCPAVS